MRAIAAIHFSRESVSPTPDRREQYPGLPLFDAMTVPIALHAERPQ